MKYTGKELYELYSRKLAEQGCITDEWGDLDEVDRSAWCALATELQMGELL